LRFTVIFDNLAEEGFVPAWGLSVLVETAKGERVLFDGGSSCTLWHRNAQKLGLDLETFEHFFVSHFHWDHTALVTDAGFAARRKKHFLITDGFSPVLVRELAERGNRLSLVREPYRFSENLLSLGSMPATAGLSEHALLAFEGERYALVVGCSHPGILTLVRRAVKLTGRPPLLVIGGFHLFGEDELKTTLIAEEMLELGVELVAPCHCTGERGREIFESVFGKRFLDARAGTVIEV